MREKAGKRKKKKKEEKSREIIWEETVYGLW